MSRVGLHDRIPAAWLLRADNPVALAVARKLFAMNATHQLQGPGTDGYWGRPVDADHGELGVLQVFAASPLVGGGGRFGGSRPAGVEPNSTGLSDVALQLDHSAALRGGVRY